MELQHINKITALPNHHYLFTMKKSIKAFLLFTAVAVGSLLSACQSIIYDDQGDCSVHYRVPFSYTKNILDDDAFSSQVASVTLYVYDENGTLVFTKTESGEILKSPDYAMDVELDPGHYSMLAWCTGTPAITPAISFAIGGGENPASITELSATLPLQSSNGALFSDNEIVPLFHGYSPSVEFPDTYGYITLPAIELTKDTNTFIIALENLDGSEIDPEALKVSIEASNSEMDWQNEVIGNTAFTYRPWSITQLSSIRPENSRDSEDGSGDNLYPMTGLLTELTTGRVMINRNPKLVITRQRDKIDIIRLDLIELLCKVRGHFGSWSAQEYLDRIDRYPITFFIDADLNWYTANGINILGWNIVPPQNEQF